MFWTSRKCLVGLCLYLAAAAGGVTAQRQVLPAGKITTVGPGKCETCHAGLADVRLSTPTAPLAFDLHAKSGLGCADCHGGNASTDNEDLAHSAQAGFVGKFDVSAIPEMCARCHSDPTFMTTFNPGLATDQLEKYKTSRHGQLLEMGLRKVAHCASCHTAHNIRPANDPGSSVYPVNLPRTCGHCHSDTKYMAGFPIPTDQFEKYATSVHGKALLERADLGAPACNDCHGNHGAVPPGTQSVAHACGTCHAINSQMFEKSAHARVFALQELPQCTVCHNHHAIVALTGRQFNMQADSVCISCHRENDQGWKDGKAVFTLLSQLEELRTRAEALLSEAQMLGMDVSDGEFLMREFRTSWLTLRTLSHSLNLFEYIEKNKQARTQLTDARQTAEQAIDEFHFRRAGLLVSLLLAVPVLLLLYLRIRIFESDWHRQAMKN